MSEPDPVTVELRPDLDEYRKLLRSRRAIAVPLLVLLVARVMDSLFTASLVLGALALFAAAGVAHIMTTRIVLTSAAVEHHGFMVRDQTIRIDDARGILGVMTQPLASDVPTLVVQSRSTGKSLRIFGGLWNPDQLESIAEHSGAERVPKPMSGTAMDQYVPGAIPLRYRKPLTFGFGVGIVLIAAVVGGVVAYFDLNNLPYG